MSIIKKRVFIFLALLMYVTTIIACKAIDLNTYSIERFKETPENISNIITKKYNEEYGTQIEENKLSIYSTKPYEKGILILVCYKDLAPKLKLIYLVKDKEGYTISKYSEGQYDISRLKVNKVQEENNSIYYGSLDNSFFNNNEKIGSQAMQGGISILFDDGQNYKETINNNQKGYIIISNSKTMVVDFYSYNLKGEKNYFIKNFVNYSFGIKDSLWKY